TDRASSASSISSSGDVKAGVSTVSVNATPPRSAAAQVSVAEVYVRVVQGRPQRVPCWIPTAASAGLCPAFHSRARPALGSQLDESALVCTRDRSLRGLQDVQRKLSARAMGPSLVEREGKLLDSDPASLLRAAGVVLHDLVFTTKRGDDDVAGERIRVGQRQEA